MDWYEQLVKTDILMITFKTKESFDCAHRWAKIQAAKDLNKEIVAVVNENLDIPEGYFDEDIKIFRYDGTVEGIAKVIEDNFGDKNA